VWPMMAGYGAEPGLMGGGGVCCSDTELGPERPTSVARRSVCSGRRVGGDRCHPPYTEFDTLNNTTLLSDLMKEMANRGILMNTYFELIPQGDSPIRARSGLWSGELRRRQCKQCFAMLSQYQEQPCAVDLDWDGFPSYSLPLLDYRLPVIVMHQRIATELRPYIVGCWSELFLRGEEASDYSVLVASPFISCYMGISGWLSGLSRMWASTCRRVPS
jgi:hypothetical protein